MILIFAYRGPHLLPLLLKKLFIIVFESMPLVLDPDSHTKG